MQNHARPQALAPKRENPEQEPEQNNGAKALIAMRNPEENRLEDHRGGRVPGHCLKLLLKISSKSYFFTKARRQTSRNPEDNFKEGLREERRHRLGVARNQVADSNLNPNPQSPCDDSKTDIP